MGLVWTKWKDDRFGAAAGFPDFVCFKDEKPRGIRKRPEDAVKKWREEIFPCWYFTTSRSPYYPALLSVYQ